MNKLLDYLKLIPKAIQNPEKIIEGIVNDVKLKAGTLPEDQIDEIVRRRLICLHCPFMSENAKNNPALAAQMKRDTTVPHCIHCLCDIEYKTACLNCNCGIEQYNREHPDSPIPLKWKRYIKITDNDRQSN